MTVFDATALTHGRTRRWREEGIRWGLFICALLSIATTAGILYTLCIETFHFFQEVSPREFFTSTQWAPLFDPAHFGVAPLVLGTLLVALLAALFAVPTGLLAAIYMSEYASRKARGAIKPILEILAGIPTVVYGYFALMAITPRAAPGHPHGLSAGALSLGRGGRVQRGRRRHRRGGDDPAHHRLAVRRRPARRAGQPAPGGLRHGRHEDGSQPAGDGACGAVGHHRLDHPGGEPRHRRDDDRGHRLRRYADDDLQSAGERRRP